MRQELHHYEVVVYVEDGRADAILINEEDSATWWEGHVFAIEDAEEEMLGEWLGTGNSGEWEHLADSAIETFFKTGEKP